MEHLLPRPSEMDFDATNLAAAWKKWKQSMKLYLNAVMRTKTEEEKYSTFLFVIGDRGREIFNTWVWDKVEADGVETEEDDITIKALYERYEEYCIPKRNLVIERRRFFLRNQDTYETIDGYVTELRNLASTCEFETLNDGLILYKMVDGIRSDKVRDNLLRKGADLTLTKAINICRADELTRTQMKLMTKDKEVAGISKKKNGESQRLGSNQYGGQRQSGGLQRLGSNQYGGQRQSGGSQRLGSNQHGGQHSTGERCKKCGRMHEARKCPAYGQECRKCKKLNHWASCCNTKFVQEASTSEETYLIEAVSSNTTEKINHKEATVILKINNKMVKAKIDTGAEVNVMPKRVFDQLTERRKLNSTSVKLHGYGGYNIPILGTTEMQCEYNQKKISTTFYVVETSSKTVMSLKTCQDLKTIKLLSEVQKDDENEIAIKNSAIKRNFDEKLTRIKGKSGKELKEEVLKMYPKLFKGLGKLEPAHHMEVNKEATPVIHPPRKIPATLREKLKKELNEMEESGVIIKVEEPTEWVNSLVVVEKPNGQLRLCLDPRDLNKVLKREHYQLPTFEEISTRLAGATTFTKLDANKGYWQIPLDEASSYLTTMNTPFGRYRFTRLPFGIHSAQEVFHKRISQSFENIEQVETDIDDILIWGIEDQDHDKNLIRCLDRAKEIGITMNINKCKFKEKELTYLGHKLSADGIHADETKIKAICEMQMPTDKKGIQRLLGMVNYVAKFLPNVSEVTAPLRELLKKNEHWQWKSAHTDSFNKIKEMLISKQCLAFYDVKREVTLQVDACKTGLGAALIQDGKSVAYASRSMTSAQRNYAIIEKELLAVLFGCERFHQHIYGKKVQVQSDHKPLESIMKKPLSSAPARLQRMLLRLQKYDITLTHKPGKEMVLADTLSRAHTEETGEEIPEEEMVAQVHMVYDNSSATDQKLVEIKHETTKDPVLSEIANYVIEGWPNNRQNVPEPLKSFWSYREELSLINGIVFKGQRIVIPTKMRKQVLQKLHQSHMGIEKTKMRARETVFWPRINQQIEDMVKSCETCLENQRKQSKEPMMASEIPTYPFQTVGTDLFYWNGQDFVLLVDYYSRYWEIERLHNISSKTVIKKLKMMFSRLGIPEIVRSDNGTQYTSSDFKKFKKEWEFEHTTSSPHYQQSNGMAERHVQIAKKLLTKSKSSNQDLYLAILESRNTPVDGFASPAQLISGRRFRTTLPINLQLLKGKSTE